MNRLHIIFILLIGRILITEIPIHTATIKITIESPDVVTGDIYIRIYHHQIYDNENSTDYQQPDIWTEKPFRQLTMPKTGVFELKTDTVGHFFIYAWHDVVPNKTPDFDHPEPTGWYSTDFGGMEPIDIRNNDDTKFSVNIKLYRIRLFPKDAVKTEHGSLIRKKGFSVLQLWGNPEQMGYAHGFLIAPQIMDFFQFFILEDQVQSCKRYQDKIMPMLNDRYALTNDQRQELKAIIRGMKDSGTNLYIEALNREIEWIDLLALNAYGELWMDRIACTQCAFWGDMTKNSELKGGLIVGRNMDGECDNRKVTVIDFLIFAFEPQGKKRWISFKWPGFIGTYSGINEDGVYCMLNYGSRKSGLITTGHIPVTFLQRAILEEATPDNMIEKSMEISARFRCSGGGSCGAPAIIFLASPYYNQKTPAAVYEGNRFGEMIRYPGDAPTFSEYNLVGSNHFFKYGVRPEEADKVFGGIPYFSSRWRATVAINKATAWERTHHAVGTAEVIDFLQSVAAGRTEHSIIFRPNEMTVDVSNDDLKFDPWDAPFLKWTSFHVREFFDK